MATSTPLIAGRETRCMKCLRQHGCCPWKLPWWETILGLIPGVGIVSSLGRWRWRSSKIEAIAINTIVLSHSVGGQITPQAADRAVFEDERPLAVVDEADRQNEERVAEGKRLVVQNANSTALLLINFFCSIALGVCLYTARKYDKL